ncbi:MAG: glycine--tRNA ligase subunit beta [Coriobacteriia bacterium]|nr:glycine--tRNA ligase subunit beta [Coriobacteriia bacterium]MCL2870637.1 glycine--tRNA ligase subunit beta [Coriobacteriia bacterium]
MEIKPYTADLLFEIGAEEMPSTPLNAAHKQLEVLAKTAFSDARLSYEGLEVFSTPRRLSLLVKAIAERQEDIRLEFKGPSKQIAYAEDGTPQKALEGFARGKGVDLEDVELRIIDGAEYVYAVRDEKGLPAKEILPDLLQGLITGLDWPKRQRWGSGDETFIRPVRWILAILGQDLIPLNFGKLQSGNFTYGHRFLSTQQIPIAAMREYKNVLRGNKVIVDQGKRRQMILESIAEYTAQLPEPGSLALVPDKVLDEVVNLVEYPNALLCSFEEEFLRVPREILEYAMNSHQRYFAIQSEDGSLSNHFIVISNGDPLHGQQIAAGHESVIRARLADAAFFYDEDLRVGLDGWRKKLGTLLFQQKLGTLADKSLRVTRLVAYLCEDLDLPAQTTQSALRVAELAKADLTSNTVIEFTELQGVIGAYYAKAQGESDEVAEAIRQHYLPRYSGDDLPASTEGQLVSLADKVDTVVGIIAAGFAPKGTSDPYALRRNAIGVLRIVMDRLPLNVEKLIREAIKSLPEGLKTNESGPEGSEDCTEELVQKVLRFFTSRLDSMLRDRDYSTEVISAVLAAAAQSPADSAARCEALHAFLGESSAWENLSTAYTRAKNLSDPEAGVSVDVALLDQHEQAFYDALVSAGPRIQVQLAEQRYSDYLSELADVREPLDAFFDNVMVMDEDETLRRNRLALLNVFIAQVEPFADLRRLSKQK